MLSSLKHNIGVVILNKYKFDNGFSLIEVLVAMMIVGVLLVGILKGFGGSLRSTSLVRNQITAANLANERLQFLKIYELNPLYNYDSNIWLTGSPQTVNQNNITYTITTTKYEYGTYGSSSSGKDNTVIPIQVKVTWNDGKTRELIMKTFYYQKY